MTDGGEEGTRDLIGGAWNGKTTKGTVVGKNMLWKNR